MLILRRERMQVEWFLTSDDIEQLMRENVQIDGTIVITGVEWDDVADAIAIHPDVPYEDWQCLHDRECSLGELYR